MHIPLATCLLIELCLCGIGVAAEALPAPDPGVSQTLLLAPGAKNPRNSPGDFVHLKEGRILFVYARTEGTAREPAGSRLVSRVSGDDGQHWSDRDEEVLAAPKEAKDVGSVSLLRMSDGRIAIFCLVSKSPTESWMEMRTSRDEAKSWSDATICTPGEGYVLGHNSRVVQLKSGRIVVPVSRHLAAEEQDGFHRGTAVCFLSDDAGVTWRMGKGGVDAAANSRSGMQHPVVVELKDGRLMMLMSMHLRPLQRAYSSDGGETWTPPQTTDLQSPIAPASLKRVPATGDLLLVWNDHQKIDPALKNSRTPLTAALSQDDGKTWPIRKDLYADPQGSYSFVAIDFAGERVLLAHHFAEKAKGNAGLSQTAISRFDLKSLSH